MEEEEEEEEAPSPVSTPLPSPSMPSPSPSLLPFSETGLSTENREGLTWRWVFIVSLEDAASKERTVTANRLGVFGGAVVAESSGGGRT